MFFKKKKAPPQKAAEPVKPIAPLPFYQTCRKLDIATPNDFGHLHEEYYGGLFCKTPWVRVSFSVPDSDWSEFRKSSHFQNLVLFLEELSKRNPPSQPNVPEDSQEYEYYKSEFYQ